MKSGSITNLSLFNHQSSNQKEKKQKPNKPTPKVFVEPHQRQISSNSKQREKVQPVVYDPNKNLLLKRNMLIIKRDPWENAIKSNDYKRETIKQLLKLKGNERSQTFLNLLQLQTSQTQPTQSTNQLPIEHQNSQHTTRNDCQSPSSVDSKEFLNPKPFQSARPLFYQDAKSSVVFTKSKKNLNSQSLFSKQNNQSRRKAQLPEQRAPKSRNKSSQLNKNQAITDSIKEESLQCLVVPYDSNRSSLNKNLAKNDFSQANSKFRAQSANIRQKFWVQPTEMVQNEPRPQSLKSSKNRVTFQEKQNNSTRQQNTLNDDIHFVNQDPKYNHVCHSTQKHPSLLDNVSIPWDLTPQELRAAASSVMALKKLQGKEQTQNTSESDVRKGVLRQNLIRQKNMVHAKQIEASHNGHFKLDGDQSNNFLIKTNFGCHISGSLKSLQELPLSIASSTTQLQIDSARSDSKRRIKGFTGNHFCSQRAKRERKQDPIFALLPTYSCLQSGQEVQESNIDLKPVFKLILENKSLNIQKMNTRVKFCSSEAISNSNRTEDQILDSPL